MPAIKLSVKRRFHTGSELEIDPSAPYAEFISGFWLLGSDQPFINRIGKPPHVTESGSPALATGHLGPYRVFNGSSTYYTTGSGISGDLSYLVVCMRSEDTPTSGPSMVEEVIGQRAPGGDGFEFNLGNAFGAAGDLNKPRIGFYNGGSLVAAAMNGELHAAVNPFPIALQTGQWAGIAFSATGVLAGSNVRFGSEPSGTYWLKGGIQFVVEWRGVALRAPIIAKLSADPYSIFMPRRRSIIGVPAAGGGSVTGTAAQALPALGQAASGSQTFTGTAAQTLAALQQALAGAETFAGTAAQTIPAIQQAAAGDTSSALDGTVEQALPSLGQAASGTETFTGSAAQTLPSAQQAATGTSAQTASGAAAQALPTLRQELTGTLSGDVYAVDNSAGGGGKKYPEIRLPNGWLFRPTSREEHDRVARMVREVEAARFEPPRVEPPKPAAPVKARGREALKQKRARQVAEVAALAELPPSRIPELLARLEGEIEQIMAARQIAERMEEQKAFAREQAEQAYMALLLDDEEAFAAILAIL